MEKEPAQKHREFSFPIQAFHMYRLKEPSCLDHSTFFWPWGRLGPQGGRGVVSGCMSWLPASPWGCLCMAIVLKPCTLAPVALSGGLFPECAECSLTFNVLFCPLFDNIDFLILFCMRE